MSPRRTVETLRSVWMAVLVKTKTKVKAKVRPCVVSCPSGSEVRGPRRDEKLSEGRRAE